MTHLDESTLQAHLDGEVPADARPQVEAHLDRCVDCARKLREQDSLAGRVSSTLDLLETDPGLAEASTLDGVRWSLRREWALRRTRSRHKRLAAAAGIALLLAGGAVSAHPSSPVRDFMASVWAGMRGPGATPVALQGSDEARAWEAAAVAWPGVRGDLRDGRLRVELRGIEGGATLHVRLVDGERAGLYAEGEARFSTASGLLAAEISTGDVLVEIPRFAAEADILIGDLVVLRKRDADVLYGVPAAERIGDDEVRIRLPEHGS